MRFRLLLLLALGAACRSDPGVTGPFFDGFERAEIGPDYYNSGGPYRIERGMLTVAGAHNHPLWLKRRLPANVKVELDAISHSPLGDLKVEFAGDGQSAQPAAEVERRLRYTASGYALIFGGWGNERSVLARRDEHAPGAPQRTLPKVELGRTYHFTIVRRDGHIDWRIDGKPFLELDDKSPLLGKHQDHFGFSDWETLVAFDNLAITPL